MATLRVRSEPTRSSTPKARTSHVRWDVEGEQKASSINLYPADCESTKHASADHALRRELRCMIKEAFVACRKMQEATCLELCRSVGKRLEKHAASEDASASLEEMYVPLSVSSTRDKAGFGVPSPTFSMSSRLMLEDSVDSRESGMPFLSNSGPRIAASLLPEFTAGEVIVDTYEVPMAKCGGVRPEDVATIKEPSFQIHPPEPNDIPVQLPGMVQRSLSRVVELSMQRFDDENVSRRHFRTTRVIRTALSPDERWIHLCFEALNWNDPSISTVNKEWKLAKTPVTANPRQSTSFTLSNLLVPTTLKTSRPQDRGLREQLPSEDPAPFWVLHPHSPRRFVWDIMGMLICTYEVLMLPVQTSFVLHPTYDKLRMIIDHCTAVFWLIDLLVTFASGYTTSEGLIEMRPWPIAKRYLMSWFASDCVVVTADWVALMTKFFSDNSGSMRVGKTVSRLLRAVRVVRWFKARERFAEAFGMITSELLLVVLTISRPLALVVACCHYAACAWYALSTSLSNGWTSRALESDHQSSEAYAASLHWTLAQFTLGTSSSTKLETRSEHLFASVLVLIALFCFSYFHASCQSALAQFNVVDRCAAEEISVRRYLVENKIPRTLGVRVNQFMRKTQRMTHRRRVAMRDVETLRMLPKHIQQHLIEHTYFGRLNVHPVFRVLGNLEREAMQMFYMTSLEEKFMLPEEELFTKEEPVDRMLFVLTGTLMYTYARSRPNEKKASVPVEVTVSPNQWACEEALWAADSFVAGPFIAYGGPCQLITILSESFRDVAFQAFSRSTVRLLAAYAQNYVEEFNAASEEFAMKSERNMQDLLFNNYGTTREALMEAAGEAITDSAILAMVHYILFEE
eukprot:TRINITY_DN29420_c0_g1_i1.p1 TRINITY_DN29420_c0_g1~~TRINITY_DN29420_c0_g1_i1.p1  ORF type:complete len:857 (-),score=135.09 TRINITY_DN29420_c0_g1_i1:462-3032(-)